MGINFFETMRIGRTKALVFGAAVLVAIVVSLLLTAETARAVATFTVDRSDDPDLTTTPIAGDCTAAANDDCSLRGAILRANATPNSGGPDVINFAIPGGGPHTISPNPALPDITEAVIINGYSESLGEATPAKANTLAVGDNAVLKIVLSGASMPNPAQNLESGLKIKASNSTVQGLVINDWEIGIFVDAGTTANQVMGNYIGTNANGTEPLGNNEGVVVTNSSDNTIGGTTAAARNIISGNSTYGILITSALSTLNEVQGNYIGTDVNGTVVDPDGIPNNGDELGNGLDGVRIHGGADDNTIGGTTAGAGNIISGNGVSGTGGDGVEVRFDIGVDTDAAAGNSILSNSIYDNDELGIDLVHSNNATEEVTLNDADDVDGVNPDSDPPGQAIAPNRFQNFPVIASAKLTTKRIGGHRRKVTLITGTLNSEADKAYNVQFFGSPVADPSGYGEGKTFLGQKSVSTNSSGDASFTFTSRKKVPKGQVVTATATDKTTGDTSEFSEAKLVS